MKIERIVLKANNKKIHMGGFKLLYCGLDISDLCEELTLIHYDVKSKNKINHILKAIEV